MARSDFPKSVHIKEEGPREGFQFEKGHIPTERKIELIDALSKTGLTTIQIVSFVQSQAGARAGRCRGGCGRDHARAWRDVRRPLA